MARVISVYKRTALLAACLAFTISINNIIWHYLGVNINWITSVYANGSIGLIAIICYFFENKATKYFLLLFIMAIAIISNISYPSGKWAFMVQLMCLSLMLYWGLSKYIIYAVLIIDFAISMIGEFLLWGSVNVVINISLFLLIVIPVLYFNGKDVIEIIIKKEVDKRCVQIQNNKEQEILNIKKEYLSIIKECKDNVKKNNSILMSVQNGKEC